jgi:hypothetical protein
LHGDRFAALGFNVRNDALSAGLARNIIDDDRRAFRREPFGDSRANAFCAPVTTAVLSDNLFMTFHPPNFPSTDVLANLRKETADRGGDRSLVEWLS